MPIGRVCLTMKTEIPPKLQQNSNNGNPQHWNESVLAGILSEIQEKLEIPSINFSEEVKRCRFSLRTIEICFILAISPSNLYLFCRIHVEKHLFKIQYTSCSSFGLFSYQFCFTLHILCVNATHMYNIITPHMFGQRVGAIQCSLCGFSLLCSEFSVRLPKFIETNWKM